MTFNGLTVATVSPMICATGFGGETCEQLSVSGYALISSKNADAKAAAFALEKYVSQLAQQAHKQLGMSTKVVVVQRTSHVLQIKARARAGARLPSPSVASLPTSHFLPHDAELRTGRRPWPALRPVPSRAGRCPTDGVR